MPVNDALVQDPWKLLDFYDSVTANSVLAHPHRKISAATIMGKWDYINASY